MVDEFMERMSYELNIDDNLLPADYFDLMGGMGFGGQVHDVVQAAIDISTSGSPLSS
jgi:hypothetical protein